MLTKHDVQSAKAKRMYNPSRAQLSYLLQHFCYCETLVTCKFDIHVMRKSASVLVLIFILTCNLPRVTTQKIIASSVAAKSLAPFDTNSTQLCIEMNSPCVSAPGRPSSGYAPCCDKSLRCAKDPSRGGGRFCFKPNSLKNGRSSCSKNGEKCLNDEKKSDASYRKCCHPTSLCVRDSSLGEGYFCKSGIDIQEFPFSSTLEAESPLRGIFRLIRSMYNHKYYSLPKVSLSEPVSQKVSGQRRQKLHRNQYVHEGAFAERSRGVKRITGNASSKPYLRLGASFGCATADDYNTTLEAPAFRVFDTQRKSPSLLKNQAAILLVASLLPPEKELENCIFKAEAVPVADVEVLLEMVTKVAEQAVPKENMDDVFVKTDIFLLQDRQLGEGLEKGALKFYRGTNEYSHANQIDVGIRLLLTVTPDSSHVDTSVVLSLARHKLFQPIDAQLVQAFGRPSTNILSIIFTAKFAFELVQAFIIYTFVVMALVLPIYLSVSPHISFVLMSRIAR